MEKNSEKDTHTLSGYAWNHMIIVAHIPRQQVPPPVQHCEADAEMLVCVHALGIQSFDNPTSEVIEKCISGTQITRFRNVEESSPWNRGLIIHLPNYKYMFHAEGITRWCILIHGFLKISYSQDRAEPSRGPRLHAGSKRRDAV